MKTMQNLLILVSLAALSAAHAATTLPPQKVISSIDIPFDEKAATVQTLGSRATVSRSATLYGGFTLVNSTTVYILIRGPSLVSLGVIPSALDAPWVRLYDVNNSDLVTQGGVPGFTGCLSSASTDKPVVDYYQSVRNAPVQPRDSCIAVTLPAGVYTFTVTPSEPGITSPSSVSSAPSAGEILFEVTLGPASSEPPNKVASARLIGGVWTYLYTIISTFSDQYIFQSVDSSPNSSGEYFVRGTDSTGGPIAGGYDPTLGMWAVLDPSIIIDKFYTFKFTSDNVISGCYYQISPPGSTNLSRCYPLTGSRNGLAMMRGKLPGNAMLNDERLLSEVGPEPGGAAENGAVLGAYQRQRNGLLK